MNTIEREFYNNCIPCRGLTVKFTEGQEVKHDGWYRELAGKFCSNNGVLGFVNEKGELWVTLASNELRKKMAEEYKYQEQSFNIPLSNSEEILHNERYKRLWQQLHETDKAKRNILPIAVERLDYEEKEKQQNAKLAMLKDLAKEKGIKDLPEIFYDLSIDINHLKVRGPSGNESEYEDTYLKFDPLLKTTNIGTYNSNNSVGVVLTPNGKTYCVFMSNAIRKWLSDAGYKENQSMYVPLSNSEEIIEDEIVTKKWKMLAEFSLRDSNPEKAQREDLYIKSRLQYLNKEAELREMQIELQKMNEINKRLVVSNISQDAIIDRPKALLKLSREQFNSKKSSVLIDDIDATLNR